MASEKLVRSPEDCLGPPVHRASEPPMNGRDQVRRYAQENGYELSTPYGLDTFTRHDGRKVEVDYARGGRRIQGIWVNNALVRGATRKDALAALTSDRFRVGPRR